MCTVAYLKSAGLLSKNRDKEIVTAEEIVATGDYVAVRSVGDEYFSLGVNRHGFAFVSTAINSPQWTQLVEQGEAEKAKTVFADERRGQHSPTKHLSQHFTEIRSIEDALALFRDADKPWMGYNVVMADGTGATVLETFENTTHQYALKSRDIVTNHFRGLDHGAKTFDDYPSTFERHAYVGEYLAEIESREDLEKVIHPSDDAGRAARIWRKGAFSTVSSSVIEIGARQVYYADGLDHNYAPYGLT